MRWQFWKNGEENQNDTSPSDKSPQSGDKLTHKELDARIEKIVSEVTERTTPQIEDIQSTAGDIKAIQNWLEKPKAMVEIVLNYAKEERAPTKKEVIYGNVFSKGDIPDLTEGTEYKERLEEYLRENRPEDGFFKNFTQSSLDQKQAFLTNFELFAEALQKDVATEKEQQEESLHSIKEKAYVKISELYGFYDKLKSAVDNGDLDAMLDISHNRTESVVKRVLKMDLSQMKEREEITALVKHIGVYDKIVELAANVGDKNSGLKILGKVLEDISDPFKVLSFMEDVFAKMPAQQGEVHDAYMEFLESYIGDYLLVSDEKAFNIEALFGISLSDDNKKLTLYSRSGLNKLNEEVVVFKDENIGKAYMRVLTQREDFVALASEHILFNLRYAAFLKGGYFNPAKEEAFGEPKNISRDPDAIFPETTEFAATFMTRIDDRGWTALDIPHIDTPEAFEALAVKVEKYSALKEYGELPLIDSRDIAAARYDKNSNCLIWAVPCASYGLEWYRHEMSQNSAKATLKLLCEDTNSNFIQVGEDWVYNLDKVQRVEFGELPDDFASIEAPTMDFLQDAYFNDGQELVMEEVSLGEVLNELDLGDDVMEEISLDDFEENALDDAGIDTMESVEIVPPTPKVLRFSFQSGENGFTDVYESGLSEDQSKALMSMIATTAPQMVAVNAHFIANTNQLYIATAEEVSVKDVDHYGLETGVENETPMLTMAFYDNIGEYSEITLPVDKERMTTVISDLGDSNGAFVHTNKVLGYDSFAAFPQHLTGIASESVANKTTSLKYMFDNSNSPESKIWSLEYDNEGAIDADNEARYAAQDNVLKIRPHELDNTTTSLSKQNIVSVEVKKGDLRKAFLKVTTNTGHNGLTPNEFKDLSEIHTGALMRELKVCGQNKTAISKKPRSKPTPKAVSAPSAQ